jgi:hypothetical protein
MKRVCQHCGAAHDYALLADGDLARTYDYGARWEGLRFLCPTCGEVQKVSFAPVSLTDAAPFPLPEGLHVRAIIREGPEVVPLPKAEGGPAAARD